MTDRDRGTTCPWTPGEPLAEVLHLLRMRGVFYCRSEVSAPWALQMPAFEDCASFHVVVSGEAVLDVPRADENPVRLVPGDLAVVPHGAIRSEPAPLHAGRVDLLPQEMIGEHCSVLRYGGGGDRTVLVCGVVEFGHPTARRLMRSLPPVLRSGTAGASRGGAARFLLDLMVEEAPRMRLGGGTGSAIRLRVGSGVRAGVQEDDGADTGVGAYRCAGDDRMRAPQNRETPSDRSRKGFSLSG
ncbi:cupin domain-containing protein [Rhodococcus pyridinivorans]|uniref:cupin domain-containing protein n=1 Tax=Rhodococcus pyridinivorans TaxID=103816 RepID=UPI003BEF2FB1